MHHIVSVSSDGPYLHAKHVNGGTRIEYELEQLAYTGPLFASWVYDGAHELEGVRRSISSLNADYSC